MKNIMRIKLTLLLTCSLLLAGCSHSPVLKYHQDVSRDFTYLSFDDFTPFKVRSIVGGEHVSAYLIWGIPGEEYVVKVLSIKGEVYSSINCDGCKILSNSDNSHEQTEGYEEQRFQVLDPQALISVEASAHPYAEYELVIQRLN